MKKKRLLLVIILLMGFLLAGCQSMEETINYSEKDPFTKDLGTMEQQNIVLSEILMASPLSKETVNPAGELQDTCSCMMVRIGAGGLIGSGVIIQGDEQSVQIVTAGHVLDRAEKGVTLEFLDGYRVQATNYRMSEKTDLALIVIPRESLLEDVIDADRVGMDHAIGYRKVRIDKQAYDGISVGDTVIAMGSFDGVGEDAYAGVLSADYIYAEDFQAYMMLAKVPVKPGMSGGGLFDKNGNLLGILCGNSEDGEVAVAPLIDILALLEEE